MCAAFTRLLIYTGLNQISNKASTKESLFKEKLPNMAECSPPLLSLLLM